MRKNIIKLANWFDQKGQTNKADRLDSFVIKWAQHSPDQEPTAEDLAKEEEWLLEENLDEISSDEEALEGLEGEDRGAAATYLNGSPMDEIKALLEELQKQKDNLQKVLSKTIGDYTGLSRDLGKLSNLLDQKNLTKQADFFDKINTKIAQGLPPDDFDDDELSDMEPTTDELLKLEEDEDGQLYKFLEFAQQLVDGNFISLESAQHAAKQLLQEYDDSMGMSEMDSSFPSKPPEFKEDDFTDESSPENVLQFPKP